MGPGPSTGTHGVEGKRHNKTFAKLNRENHLPLHCTINKRTTNHTKPNPLNYFSYCTFQQLITYVKSHLVQTVLCLFYSPKRVCQFSFLFYFLTQQTKPFNFLPLVILAGCCEISVSGKEAGPFISPPTLVWKDHKNEQRTAVPRSPWRRAFCLHMKWSSSLHEAHHASSMLRIRKKRGGKEADGCSHR